MNLLLDTSFFEELSWKKDLQWFEGSLISLYTSTNRSFLSRWVDSIKDVDRYVFSAISNATLMQLMEQNISVSEATFYENPCVYIIDILKKSNHIKSVYVSSKESIPKDYIPQQDAKIIKELIPSCIKTGSMFLVFTMAKSLNPSNDFFLMGSYLKKLYNISHLILNSEALDKKFSQLAWRKNSNLKKMPRSMRKIYDVANSYGAKDEKFSFSFQQTASWGLFEIGGDYSTLRVLSKHLNSYFPSLHSPPYPLKVHSRLKNSDLDFFLDENYYYEMLEHLQFVDFNEILRFSPYQRNKLLWDYFQTLRRLLLLSSGWGGIFSKNIF
jgi:hypothetical protein